MAGECKLGANQEAPDAIQYLPTITKSWDCQGGPVDLVVEDQKIRLWQRGDRKLCKSSDNANGS